MLQYLDTVTIEDAFVNESFRLEKAYLLSLDVDRLLAGFRETAGLAPRALRYKGWESLDIQGHTMGHYLTALAQAYAMTKDEVFLGRIRSAVGGLAACQRADGFLFASDSVLFDRLERGEEAWVPWYTMHKVLAGLVSAARLPGDAAGTARRVMTGLADWITDRVLAWNEETKHRVWAVEYGGMNDCLYDVYALTGEERYYRAAHQFDELPLFEAMHREEDILDGLHANTTIPKILGGLKRYAVSTVKEPFYLEMAERFWKMVTAHHSYITGGNSEWEHFGPADVLDGERTACNCETCNTYNMLKLSQLLFALTGKKKYADYDEWTYINAILSSQNHETGMSMYFQPMATGYFKVYSRPYDQFWCCTGTGMENFTKPWRGVAFAAASDETGRQILYINRLISSRIEWGQAGISAELRADWLHSDQLRICFDRLAGRDEAAADGEAVWAALRIPGWAAGDYQVLAGQEQVLEERDGYLYIRLSGTEPVTMVLRFPRTLQAWFLPDNDHAAAFSWGPFVLSAELGTENQRTETTGVDVTIPTRAVTVSDTLVLDGPKDQWQRAWQPDDREGHFLVTGADGQVLRFTPHFLKNGVRYGLYFILQEGLKADGKEEDDA